MRRLAYLSLVCFSVVCVGCSFDEAGIQPLSDGDAGVGNPGTPDAMVVGCTSNDDCASPPDLCHNAGTCSADGTCQFAPVDCSAMNGTCVAGQCDPSSGACVQAPADEGAVCGDPLIGEWSDCASDASCGTNGSRARLVSAQTCTAGLCTPDDPVEETDNCTIPPEQVFGTPCGPVSCGDWSDCEGSKWGDQCSTDGEKFRECSGSTCSIIGACEPDTWYDSTSCVLDTNGDECWGCWGGGGGPGGDCVCDGGMCVQDTN